MSEVTYKDCIITAAKFLELGDVEEALKGTATTFTGELGKTVSTLITCVDLVINEIACDYIPLKIREQKTTKNSKINFSDLSKNIVDLYTCLKGGRQVKFETFHDCIVLPFDGTYDITYSYAPSKGTLTTKLEWNGQRVGERIAAYGIACEFALMNGLTEDAALWDKRFKDALFKASIQKNERVVRRRLWQ